MAEPADIGIGARQENYDDDRAVAGIDGTVFLDRLAGPRGGIVGRRVAAFWMNQIIQVDDDRDFKNWLKRGTSIEKRYRDERRRTTDEDNQRRVNSLWANVEILTPALYGHCPVPVCERRFRDKDPVGRGAAQILERALRNEIEICGFDEAMRQALRDYLLPGRGTVWVRYEPKYGEGISIPTDDDTDQHDSQGNIRRDQDGNDSYDNHPDSIRDDDALITDEEEKLRTTGNRITRESTPVDFIQWTDFYTFPARARTWKEVTAVGKRVYMTRNQMKRRFGNEIGKAIPFQRDDRKTRRQEDTQQGHEVDEKAQIFEIWDKSREEVIWVAEGYQYLCDRQDDPLRLENFFPCPKPLYANPTNNTLIPVPDFIQYQDQAIQIDELTQRISMLAKCCKVAGVYNAAAKGIQRLFNESVENEMIPVDDWAAFAEKGGVAGNLSFIPLKEIMGVIEELTKIKERNVAEMDRLTGLNDVMRGVAEDARETAGSQRMQAAASGTRLQHRQDEVARFARDTLRIMADIMCRHFSDKSLIEVSGALCEEGLGTTAGQCDDPSEMDALILNVLQNIVPPVQLGPPGLFSNPGGSFSPMGGAPPIPQPPQPPPAGGMMPPGLPSPPMQMGGQAGPSPMGVPPQGMQGGMPPPQGVPPQGMLPQQPGLPMQGPPQPQPGASQGMPPPQRPGQFGFQGPMMPQIPPEIQDKLQGLQRIARSLKLIRNEKLIGFRVDIEVESTIYADQQVEGQQRTAFIAAITKYLQQSMQISAMMPQAAPFLGKLMQFGIRGFKIGRDLEQSIEDFCDEAAIFAKQHAQQASQQPNPIQLKAQADMAKAQADIQGAHMKMQTDQQQAQAEIQRQQIENQGEIANSQADTQQKAIDLEMRKLEMQIELTRLQIERMKAEAALKQEGIKQQTTQQENWMDQQDHALDRASEQHKSALDYAAQQQKHEADQQKTFLQGAQDFHKMKMQAEQTENERKLQQQQHEHDRKQAAMQHKIAQIKLQQQRAAARRPRTTQ